MVKNFLVQKHYWTIWFLAALFFTEILYYWIYRLTSQKSYLTTIFSTFILFLGLLLAKYLNGRGIPWNIDIALIAQFFFHIGHFLYRGGGQNDKHHILHYIIFDNMKYQSFSVIFWLMINVILAKLCIVLSGESLDMSIGMYGNALCSMISALSGTFAIIGIANILKFLKPLIWLGQNTMVIFAWHSRIIIEALGILFSNLNIFQESTLISQYCQAFVSFIVILMCLIPLTLAIKKTKIHSLFGV